MPTATWAAALRAASAAVGGEAGPHDVEDPTAAQDVRGLLLADSGLSSPRGLLPRGRSLAASAAAAVAAGAAAVALLVVLAAPGRPAEGGLPVAGRQEVSSLALVGAPKCGSDGEECTHSHCCWSGGKTGLQCYAKDDFWATCSETCKKGMHPNEYDGKAWSCKELGNRSLPAPQFCPKPGENCLKAPCCASGGKQGLQCFQKNATFAECRETCDKSGSHGNWDCTPLGARSSPAPEFCPKSGENCLDKQCCHADGPQGMQCYRKNKFYAGCMPPGSCKKVQKFGNKTETWSCDPLGAPSAPGEKFCPLLNQNCIDSHCCAAGGANGLQCYKKDETYAGCMESCDPRWQKGFTCEKLGTRSSPDPCSAPGEDCRKSKCCSSQRNGKGMTCFEKNSEYATCMEACDKDDWSCKALGNRTPFTSDCTWGGDDCGRTRCCNNLGYECAVKNKFFSGCVQTMKSSTWMTTQVPLPAGWDGKVLGGGRSEFQVQAAGNQTKVAGTSLYCFMAILPNSTEVALMELAKKNKAGIFACEAHDVYHSWQSGSAGWDTGASTLVNTDVFISVFDQVRQKGKFLMHDWSIKADADCVFVPDRLRAHMQKFRPPADTGIYWKNNGMDPGLGNNGFLGAIEIFSRRALQIYFDNAPGCKKYFGLGCGEDGFFKGCMDALGVGYMKDVDIFFPDHGSGACRQGQRVAFHPLKDPKKWQHCWDIIIGKTKW